MLPGKWDVASERLLIPLEMEHHDPRAFQVVRLEGTRDMKEVEVNLDFPGGMRGPAVPMETDELVAQIENKGVVRATVGVNFDKERGLKQMTLQFSEEEGGRWIKAMITGWRVERVAFVKEEPEREETPKDWFMRQVYEDQAREDRAKQAIVGPLAGMGACWLADGLGGVTEKIEAGSCWEIGARLTYPVLVPNHGGTNLAVEAEISGVLVDDVQFEEVSVDGEVGRLTRSATIGRALVGLSLRFGDQSITSLRLGLGLQGARQRASFTAGDGPGASTDVGSVLSWGVGFDRRLTKTLLLGATLTINGLTSDASRPPEAIRAGLALRYAWNP